MTGADARYTRETFERRRQEFKRAERKAGVWLALFSVGLGLAQIGFIRWADRNLDRSLEVSIAGPVFLAYLAVVGLLLWNLEWRRRRALPRCPVCATSLKEMSQRIAVATGRCDACGGQVIE